MSGLYTHTTRAAGITLTANIYNTDHTNHITNHVPEQMDDYSANVAEMQTNTDPYPASSESLATTFAGEIERLRYQISEIGKRFNSSNTQWYQDIAYFRSIRIRIQPGGTPGTNINVTNFNPTIYGYHVPTITNATNMGKGVTVGSFTLNAGGTRITMNITENIIGLLAASITLHVANTASTTAGDIWYPTVAYTGNNLTIDLYQTGSTTAEDITTIMAAGDAIDVAVLIVTDT